MTAKKIMMEKFNLTTNVKVFGTQVKTFPEGIGEAFEALGQMLTEGYDRAYYGISNINEAGAIIYKAAAEEKYEGEAKKYNYDQYIVEKGEYLMMALKDWRKKTDSIKELFHEMMQDSRVDKNSYCIEWYKSDDEMWCMIKISG